MNDKQQRLLNIGCGSTFHPAWMNIDLVSRDPQVIEHDLTRGIPCADNSCDAVYHSHVLEHLTPNAAQKMLRECFRVLKTGGILRIAVPDLEQIARTYLQTIDAAKSDEPESLANHAWMQLEMIDQLVRSESGGEMGQYMSQTLLANEDFINQRMGDEFLNCRSAALLPQQQTKQPPSFSSRIARLRDKFTRFWLRKCYGRQTWQQFEEARFRNQGEIHRWMYDRVSLSRLLLSVGFCETSVVSAEESHIANFATFELDSRNGGIRKPDSLFMEARKPARTPAQRDLPADTASDQTADLCSSFE